jgi:hypothetical protein
LHPNVPGSELSVLGSGLTSLSNTKIRILRRPRKKYIPETLAQGNPEPGTLNPEPLI